LPVECWQPIQSGSERAFEFMAKYGIRGDRRGSAEGGAVRAAHDRLPAGLMPGAASSSNWASGLRSVPVPHRSSREQAIREAAPHTKRT